MYARAPKGALTELYNEVIFLGKPLIVVSSVTYAMRGRELLTQRGFRTFTVRIPRTAESGCGYGLYVPQGADEAERVLRENNIKVLGRTEWDDGG